MKSPVSLMFWRILIIASVFLACGSLLAASACDCGGDDTADDDAVDDDAAADDDSAGVDDDLLDDDVDDDTADDDTVDDDATDDDVIDDDSADDDSIDDDTMMDEPHLFIVGSYNSNFYGFLRTDSGWKSYPAPPYTGVGETVFDGFFALDGTKIYGAWNAFDSIMGTPTGSEIWSFDLTNGWQFVRRMNGADVNSMFVVADDAWYLNTFFSLNVIFLGGRFGFFHDGQIRWQPGIMWFISNMFFLAEGEGLYGYTDGSRMYIVSLHGNVPSLITLPGHETESLETSYLFDADHGWAVTRDAENGTLWQIDDGVWTVVEAPAGCPGQQSFLVKFADENFGVVATFDSPGDYWVYDQGVWTGETLPLPAIEYPVAGQLHVVAPGWYFIGVYDSQANVDYLYEHKNGVTTRVELPSDMYTYTTVFTLGAGSPHFAVKPLVFLDGWLFSAAKGLLLAER
jgi:hypothetical protein